jgi:hypothetical protein
MVLILVFFIIIILINILILIVAFIIPPACILRVQMKGWQLREHDNTYKQSFGWYAGVPGMTGL